MRKIITIILAVAFAMAAFAVPASANYNGQQWINGWTMDLHNYHWSTANGGQWVDDVCGTSGQKFKIALFKHTNYQGPSVRVCHNYTAGGGGVVKEANFCHIPMGTNSSLLNALECQLLPWVNMGVSEDKISSVNIIGGVPNGKCIRLFMNPGHKSYSFAFDEDVPNLHIYQSGGKDWGDEASSLKKISC